MNEPWLEYEDMADRYRYPSDFEFEDVEKAIECLKTADELGSPTAPIELYQILYEDDMGNSKAREYIQRSIDRGYNFAYNWLAIYYANREEEVNQFKCGLKYLSAELVNENSGYLRDAFKAFILNIPIRIDTEVWGESVKHFAPLEDLFIETVDICIEQEYNPNDYKMRARRLGKVLNSKKLSSY